MTSVNTNVTDATLEMSAIPARVRKIDCAPTTVGKPLDLVRKEEEEISDAIAKTQERPIVVPSDVIDFMEGPKKTPKEEVLRLAYGGSKEAQQQKFDIILKDFEGLLRTAQAQSGSSPQQGFGAETWHEDVINMTRKAENACRVKKLLDETGGAFTPATDNEHGIIALLSVPLVDFVQLHPSELFGRGDDNVLNGQYTIDWTQSLSPQDVMFSTEFSANSYFMLVLALAMAQMKYGYSMAGEVLLHEELLSRPSCPGRRCCQTEDAKIPVRVGILGVLPKITADTTLLSLLCSKLKLNCQKHSDDANTASMRLISGKARKHKIHVNHHRRHCRNGTATNDALESLARDLEILAEIAADLVSGETISAEALALIVERGADLTPAFTGSSSALSEVYDWVKDVATGVGISTAMGDSIARIVQTFPSLPPASDPINKVKGTRNKDLVDAYVLNKRETQYSDTPYFYRGEAAVCRRQLPLVCVSRECPSWGMDLNNVVPFVEKCHPSQPPSSKCSCAPWVHMEDVVARVREDYHEYTLAEMLLGLPNNESLHVINIGVHGGADTTADLDPTVLETVGNSVSGITSIRSLLERHSQIFVPGVAGAFYTNLLHCEDDAVCTTDIEKRNDATVARRIANLVVDEMKPVALPVSSEMVLQQEIFDSCPNLMIPQLSRQRSIQLPAVLKALREEIAMKEYQCNEDESSESRSVSATVARMFGLDAVPKAGSGLQRNERDPETLVEGASAAVEFVEQIDISILAPNAVGAVGAAVERTLANPVSITSALTALFEDLANLTLPSDTQQ